MARKMRTAGSWNLCGLLVVVSSVCAGVLGAAEVAANRAEKALAREILDATGVKGGLIVHVGCGDGKLTAALRPDDSYMVHGLAATADDVANARKTVQDAGNYGNVSIDRLTDERLPYIDNLVNLVVAEDLGKVSMDEVMRVL